MSSRKIKFGDKEVDKKEFYSSKQASSLDSIDLSKIVASNKWNNEIWEVVLKVKFTVNPIRDGKYIIAKLKIFNGTNRTTFTNNIILIERNNYICIAAIDIDSVLKIENKRAYPQAYLEQCKYKLKKRKIVNFIDDEIVDEESNDSYEEISIEERQKIIDELIMEIVLMNDDATIPTRASKRSAGLDLYSSIDVNIEVGSIKKINTGICISLPENSYGSIRDKSSLATKGLLPLGGVIDNDYTGEIILIMTSLIEPIKIKKGQK